MLTEFKAMLKTGDYVVLDTETTGLHEGEICQIAIMDSLNSVLLDTLLLTKQPIPADATRIHGITDDMVADAPNWLDVQPVVFNLLKGRHVVIYNATYDRKMMHQTAERWGMPKTDWKEICTFWDAMTYCAEIYGDWNAYRSSYRWQKLSTMADYFKIPHVGVKAHSALGDVLTTLAICQAIAKKD